MSTPRHLNMADVAHRAGVSVATVSRALRDLPGVGAETRARIKEIAEELSYVVSPEASRLATGATGRVAVVVSHIDLWFYGSVLAGIESTLRASGVDVLVYQVGGEAARRRFFEELPARRKADALIVVTLPVPDTQARRLELLGMKVVIAGGRMLDYPSVTIDDVDVGRQAVRHLVALGHRRIGMIRTADPEGVIWSADLSRVQGYREALIEVGAPIVAEYLVTVPFGVDGGGRGMEKLLELPDPPTAVFAHSDEVALGAMRTLRRRGIEVPAQVSVIGADDHPMAALMDLTTIRQPVRQQGVLAAQVVLDMLDGQPIPERHVLVPTELVERGSTAPVD